MPNSHVSLVLAIKPHVNADFVRLTYRCFPYYTEIIVVKSTSSKMYKNTVFRDSTSIGTYNLN